MSNGADYAVTVAGTYYVQGELGKRTTKPYSETFNLLEEHMALGALSIIVSGFPGQPPGTKSLLNDRLSSQDLNFRGVRTHEIIKTTRLSARPKKAKEAHDLSLMSEDELVDYADAQALEVSFDLYDSIEEKRAAVEHCRRNPDEYALLQAEKESKTGVAKKAAKVLKELNQAASDAVSAVKGKIAPKVKKDEEPTPEPAQEKLAL